MNLLEAALAAFESGQLAEAQRFAEDAARQEPDAADPHHVLALVAYRAGQAEAANQHFERASELAPERADILVNWAQTAAALRQIERAEVLLQRALELRPQLPPAWNALGSLALQRGALDHAEQRFVRALAIAPDYSAARLNLAGTRLQQGRFSQAISEVREVIKQSGPQPRALECLGLALYGDDQAVAAADTFKQLIQAEPDNAKAWYQLGNALEDAGDWSEAVWAYEKAYALDATLTPALADALHLRRRLCDWDGLEDRVLALKKNWRESPLPLKPFALLAEPLAPEAHLEVAQRWSARITRSIEPMPLRVPNGNEPRVGIISNGFGAHPTACLFAAALERMPFDVTGFATAPDDGSEYARRIRHACGAFHEIAGQAHLELAQTIRRAEIDVLLDMRGFGGGSVSEALAHRPAPVQVNYLAYPSTQGAPFIDYLIADAFVVPDTMRQRYHEAVVRLGRCFQPNDITRELTQPPSLEELGLPREAIVFASFNNSYKITPSRFALWMQLLETVDGSVLWLLEPKEGLGIANRLRKQASAAGIDARRVVFFGKREHLEYLSCLQHADLFLDTSPYNAHTTASDALWAGVPLLTTPGSWFADRVAGSLLTELGLEGLCCDDERDYLQRAIALSRSEELANLQAQLRQRDAKLFDMDAYAADLAQALQWMHHRACERMPPQQKDF